MFGGRTGGGVPPGLRLIVHSVLDGVFGFIAMFVTGLRGGIIGCASNLPLGIPGTPGVPPPILPGNKFPAPGSTPFKPATSGLDGAGLTAGGLAGGLGAIAAVMAGLLLGLIQLPALELGNIAFAIVPASACGVLTLGFCAIGLTGGFGGIGAAIFFSACTGERPFEGAATFVFCRVVAVFAGCGRALSHGRSRGLKSIIPSLGLRRGGVGRRHVACPGPPPICGPISSLSPHIGTPAPLIPIRGRGGAFPGTIVCGVGSTGVIGPADVGAAPVLVPFGVMLTFGFCGDGVEVVGVGERLIVH
jgi:hypothetical protein